MLYCWCRNLVQETISYEIISKLIESIAAHAKVESNDTISRWRFISMILYLLLFFFYFCNAREEVGIVKEINIRAWSALYLFFVHHRIQLDFLPSVCKPILISSKIIFKLLGIRRHSYCALCDAMRCYATKRNLIIFMGMLTLTATGNDAVRCYYQCKRTKNPIVYRAVRWRLTLLCTFLVYLFREIISWISLVYGAKIVVRFS